jgi:hypothetical protein
MATRKVEAPHGAIKIKLGYADAASGKHMLDDARKQAEAQAALASARAWAAAVLAPDAPDREAMIERKAERLMAEARAEYFRASLPPRPAGPPTGKRVWL